MSEAAPRFVARGPVWVGEVEVGRAGPEDFERVAELLAHLATGAEAPIPASHAAFLRVLADPQRALLVARRGEELVGSLDLVLVDNVSRGGRPWVGIENVVVDPGARRSGVARALLDTAFDLAREAGAYKVQLLSGAVRGAAHGLYEAMGFDAPVRGFRRYL